MQVDKTCTMSSSQTSLSPCEKWLHDLKQPCGDCHQDQPNCIHCGDCNPRDFAVRLKNFKLHTSCMPFGTGVEKLLSYSLDGDYTLRRTDNGTDFFDGEDLLESESQPKDRLVPACRWAAQISINAEYLQDAEFPDDSGIVFGGDLCECFTGTAATPIRAYIEIVIRQPIPAHQSSEPDIPPPISAAVGRLRIAYEYLNDTSDGSGNRDPINWRVIIFESPLKFQGGCFSGGAMVGKNNLLDWVTGSSGTEENFGVPDGKRYCKGDVFWKACNRDFFDGPSPAKYEFGHHAPDLGSLSSDEPQHLDISPVAAGDACLPCKRVTVPMKVATDQFRTRTLLLSHQRPQSMPINYADTWRGMDDYRRVLFFNMIDETRVAGQLAQLKYKKDAGAHNDYLESVGSADEITITNYANTLEQPGYGNGRLITLDRAMLERGLLKTDNYKKVPLTVGTLPGVKSPVLTSPDLKNKFVRTISLSMSRAARSPGQAFVHLFFRYNHYNSDGEVCEQQKAYFHRVGPFEGVVDNVPSHTTGTPDKASSVISTTGSVTVEVNRIAPDFIEVVSDLWDGEGGKPERVVITKAEAVVMDAKDYLNIVVPANDYSAVWDAAGRLIVFYVDKTHRVGHDAWTSSSSFSSDPSGHSSQSSISPSSLSTISTSSDNDCGERGQCLRLTPESVGGVGCFTGETPVLMADGTEKRIDLLVVGDEIIGFDPDDNLVTTLVEEIFSITSDTVLRITIGDRTVRVTNEHPFYVGGARFRTAELLEEGDTVYVLADDGKALRAERVVRIEDEDGWHTAFNLKASGPYTYIANGVAVHNKIIGGCFTGETPIMLVGKRTCPISIVTRRSEILAFTETGDLVPTKVREIIEHIVPGFIRLETDRGMLNVTADHPFYVGDDQYRQAFRLRPNDVIFQEGGDTLIEARVISKRYVNRPATVFNLSVEEPHTFFANGVAVHNKIIFHFPPGGCFAADTPIIMADGSTKLINSLKTGERVLAFDRDDNVVEGSVHKLLPNRASNLMRLVVGGRELKTTSDHPFYMGFGRFQAAELLEVGDEVLVYSTERDLLERKEVEVVEELPGSATVWNLFVNSPNTFFANGVAVHNKGGGGLIDNHDGHNDNGEGGPDHGGGHGTASSREHGLTSDGLSSDLSSLGTSSSSSSFSSQSSSSIGCPLSDGEFNYNCNEINYRALDAITVNLAAITPSSTFCRKCEGCQSNKGLLNDADPPKGLLHVDTSALQNVCLVRQCGDGTKYTAQVSVPATAIACSFTCTRPQVVPLPLDVTLTEERGRWVLEVLVTDVDGKRTTLFYGSHWDSVKLKTQHCLPPNEFRVCNKPRHFEMSSCPDATLQSYNEISALVSNDGGMSWEKHHGVVRGVGLENFTNPVAVPDWKSNKVILLYKRTAEVGAHGEESDHERLERKTYVGTFYREVATDLFRTEDAFKDYDRPQYFGAFEEDDYFLGQYTKDGQELRIRPSYLIGGEMEPHESFFAKTRLENGKRPRLVKGKDTLDLHGNYTAYVDRKGKLRLWLTQAEDAVDDPNIVDAPPRRTSVNGDGDFCTVERLTLVVSGITDQRCPCHTLMETTTLVGIPQPDKQDRDPKTFKQTRKKVDGFVRWVSEGRKKWELTKGASGWELVSRNRKVRLVRSSANKCPANGSYRMDCGFCNGWIVGTVSGSLDNDQETSDSQSSEEKGFTEDGTVKLFTSIDGGFTWEAGNAIGTASQGSSLASSPPVPEQRPFVEWKGGRLSYVVYDDTDDTTYLFYVVPEEMLFMKVIPSGMMDSPDLQKYLESASGRIPIFIAGNIAYEDKDKKQIDHDFKGRAVRVLPQDFVMNWKMGLLHRQPVASMTPHGTVRFFYVDVNGHISSGLWNGGMPQLVAKMRRRDGSEKVNEDINRPT